MFETVQQLRTELRQFKYFWNCIVLLVRHTVKNNISEYIFDL